MSPAIEPTPELKLQIEAWLREAAQRNLNVNDARTLLILSRRGAIPCMQLATELGVSSAAITGISDRLVARGLICRQHSDEDRRAITLRLTDVGGGMLTDITLAALANLSTADLAAA